MVAEQTKERPKYDTDHRIAPRRTVNLSPSRVVTATPAGRSSQRAPMAHRGSRVVRKAQQLSWHSPMTAAVLVGTFLVTVLCCYVYAYARVTKAGFERSALLAEIKRAKDEEGQSRKNLSRLMLLSTVEEKAKQLGMVPGAPQMAEVVPETPNRALAQGQ